MKRLVEVKFTRWWQWLSPKHHRLRKTMQAFVDSCQDDIMAQFQREYINLMIYGCSIASDEFYGKGIPDLLHDEEKK